MVLTLGPSDNAAAAQRHLSRILESLQHSPTVTFIVDSKYRITYCNPAWNRFAAGNGAPQLTSEAVLGSNLFDAIPDVLRPVYSDAFRQVLSTGKVWEKLYECSSSAVFRRFRMRIHLLKPQHCFVVTNSLVAERAHEKTATAYARAYLDANGLLRMCAHCRCSNRIDRPEQWDFVPEYLELASDSRSQVSHGLCPICRVYFYPEGFF